MQSISYAAVKLQEYVLLIETMKKLLKKNMGLNITSFEIIRLWIFNSEPVTARKKLYCTFICYLSSKLLDKIKHDKHHADSTRLCQCDAVITTKEWMYFVALSLRHVCTYSAIHHIPQSAFTLK